MKTAPWDWSVSGRIIVPNHRTAKNRKWTQKIVGLAIFRNFRKIRNSLSTYIINKSKNCEKSQVNATNRRPCDFCDFSQAHEKSQISQLRANLDISAISNTTTKTALKRCYARYCGKWRRNVGLGDGLLSIRTSILLVFSSVCSSSINYISHEKFFEAFKKVRGILYWYSSCLVRNLVMGCAFGGPAALCFGNQFVRPNATALN